MVRVEVVRRGGAGEASCRGPAASEEDEAAAYGGVVEVGGAAGIGDGVGAASGPPATRAERRRRATGFGGGSWGTVGIEVVRLDPEGDRGGEALLDRGGEARETWGKVGRELGASGGGG